MDEKANAEPEASQERENILIAFDENLWKIETTLRRIIKDSPKSLLGEIGLDEKRDFEGHFFSITELSDFLISSKTVRTNLINNPIHPGHSYMAAMTIWLVNLAKNMADGTKLWKDAFEEKQLNVKLAEIFDAGMDELELEKFQGQLEGKHKYVDLARIHAIVPTYALPKFVAEVRRAASYHKSKFELVESIKDSDTVPASVKLLCDLNPVMAIDLLELCINTMSSGINLGLPSRIADALLSEASLRPLASRNRVRIPSIHLAKDTLVIEIEGDWLFKVDGKDFDPENNELPLGHLECSKDGNYWFTLYDTNNKYLLFENGRLVSSNEIPQIEPILLYSNKIKLNENELAVDPFDLDIWQGWKFANLREGKELAIEIDDLKVLLTAKKGLSFKLDIIPNLSLHGFEMNVFSSYPKVNFGKGATVRDEVTDESKVIIDEDELLWDDDGGLHQFTVRRGLGNVKKVSGFFVPGLRISGIDRSIVEGESRKLKFHLPGGWSGKSEITFNGRKNGAPTIYLLTDPDGFEHELEIDIPLLNWSIKIADQAPIQNFNTARFPLKLLDKAQSIVIHDCYGDYKPDLNIVSISSGNTEPRGPKRSNQDLRFDLRLKDSNEKLGLKLMIQWDYKNVELAVFQDVTRQRLTSLADLKDLNEKPGFFTEEQLADYNKEKAVEMAMWKMQLRKKIVRGFDD
jgi:hypothetical protein